MTKREIMKQEREKKAAEVEITLQSSIDEREVTVKFRSSEKMSALDFLMAYCDYGNDLAEQLYSGAREQDRSKN